MADGAPALSRLKSQDANWARRQFYISQVLLDGDATGALPPCQVGNV